MQICTHQLKLSSRLSLLLQSNASFMHIEVLPQSYCLLQMVLETKAGMESGVIGAGHRFAAARLDAQRTTAGWVSEQMGGLSYLMYIRQLLARVESDWESVKVTLFFYSAPETAHLHSNTLLFAADVHVVILLLLFGH